MSARCMYCRNEISWIQLPDDTGELKYIPLDLKAAVYHQTETGEWTRSNAFVNHLSVCPSRKKQRKPEKEKIKIQTERQQPWWTK